MRVFSPVVHTSFGPVPEIDKRIPLTPVWLHIEPFQWNTVFDAHTNTSVADEPQMPSRSIVVTPVCTVHFVPSKKSIAPAPPTAHTCAPSKPHTARRFAIVLLVIFVHAFARRR